MTKIEFDEPSTGNVESDDKAALSVNNSGNSANSIGVHAESDTTCAIRGISHGQWYRSNPHSQSAISAAIAGSSGSAEVGYGVVGEMYGTIGAGVWGVAHRDGSGIGVKGETKAVSGGIGVWGAAKSFNPDNKATGVLGTSSGNGIGVLGKGRTAGRFEGNVEVTGDISLLNADCAEDFDIVEENVEAGTVMVLTENGSLQQSYQEYD